MPGLVVPLHAVVIQGKVERVEMKVGEAATVAKMVPGALVVLDTTANEVKEAGAKAHGILGIIDVDAEHDIGDPYDNGDGTVGDYLPIIVPQSGAFVALTLVTGGSVVQGTSVVSSADGEVKESETGTLGGQGDIVGLAWQTATTNIRIIVLWCYTPEGQTAT